MYGFTFRCRNLQIAICEALYDKLIVVLFDLHFLNRLYKQNVTKRNMCIKLKKVIKLKIEKIFLR